MSNKKPVPLFERQPPKVCPVCGQTSYSAAGIHPQCAVNREDDKRMDRLKRIRGVNTPPTPSTDRNAWQRTCPTCLSVQQVHKKTCECGHVFGARMRSSSDEGESS